MRCSNAVGSDLREPAGRRPERSRRYGGQAVIEGVMMRGTDHLAIAVREPGGAVSVTDRPIRLWTRRPPWRNFPMLRGVAALVESVVLGIDALMFSANASTEDDRKLSAWESALTVVLSLVLAVGLFMVLPTAVVGLAGKMVPSGILLNLTEGAARLAVLLGYLWAISKMRDVARVLAYHGAEHKAINAFEAGEELVVQSVRPYPIAHPRCGTSFLLLVVIVSVLVFALFGWPGLLLRTVIRIGLLPVVAGLSYELIRASGDSKLWCARAAAAPGVFLQRFTTREPDDKQIEVALAALSRVLALESEGPARLGAGD